MDNEHNLSAAPFRMQVDSEKSVCCIIRDLLKSASTGPTKSNGIDAVDVLMKYLVMTKVYMRLGGMEHISLLSNDSDFLIGDTAVHVTNHPSEQLIAKCSLNLSQNIRPLIVTNERGVLVAADLAEAAGIEERIDVLEIGQFMATNVYERSKFVQKQRATTFSQIVSVYNEIIEKCETDPSLKIEID